MKLVLIAHGTAFVFACSTGGTLHSPIAPDPPAAAASSLASLSGMVLADSGACIADATVQIVRGPERGRIMTQKTPCHSRGDEGGFDFKDLTPDVEMTLRASASGYAARETTVVPSAGSVEQRVFLTLSRTP